MEKMDNNNNIEDIHNMDMDIYLLEALEQLFKQFYFLE